MNQNRSLTIVGVFISALAICVALLEQKPETKQQYQPQTKIEQVKKEVFVAKAKVRQQPTLQPVEVTLSGFKSSWDKDQ